MRLDDASVVCAKHRARHPRFVERLLREVTRFLARMHMVRASLLAHLGRSNVEAAETSLQQGIAVSRTQGARGWELRASTSLARLWRDQGKRTEARDLLAPIYGRFTEGFDTPDLKEAKALLDALSS